MQFTFGSPEHELFTIFSNQKATRTTYLLLRCPGLSELNYYYYSYTLLIAIIEEQVRPAAWLASAIVGPSLAVFKVGPSGQVTAASVEVSVVSNDSLQETSTGMKGKVEIWKRRQLIPLLLYHPLYLFTDPWSTGGKL